MINLKKILLATTLLTTVLFASNISDGKRQFDKKEYKKAYKTFMQISRNGMVAKFNIGYMYELGLGVDKNITKALIFYSLSANDGYAIAQNSLGNAYLKGIGVKKDLNKAVAYYKLAAQQKNKNAIASLKSISEALKKQEKARASFAYLTIRSNVNNDKVYLDGKYMGHTKLILKISSNKNHIVEVKKRGYKTYKSNSINLKPNKKKTIKVLLTK